LCYVPHPVLTLSNCMAKVFARYTSFMHSGLDKPETGSVTAH